MSKKFGKFLLFSAVAGVAAYGAYQYLQNKDKDISAKSSDDGDDDFDDFTEDLDDEPTPTKERSYVALKNLDKAEAFASEAFHKAKEKLTDSVMQVRETVKSVAEAQSSQETNFTDLTAIQKEAASHDDSVAEADPEAQDETVKETEADPQTAPADEAKAEPFVSSEPAAQTASSETVEEFFDDSTL